MRADIYDSRGNCINTLENVELVTACKDGRHLIKTIDKCICCKQDSRSTTQVPAGYTIEIKP